MARAVAGRLVPGDKRYRDAGEGWRQGIGVCPALPATKIIAVKWLCLN